MSGREGHVQKEQGRGRKPGKARVASHHRELGERGTEWTLPGSLQREHGPAHNRDFRPWPQKDKGYISVV